MAVCLETLRGEVGRALIGIVSDSSRSFEFRQGPSENTCIWLDLTFRLYLWSRLMSRYISVRPNGHLGSIAMHAESGL